MKKSNPNKAPKITQGVGGPKIRKIGLVSHDYHVLDSRRRWDYSEHFEAINTLCDAHGCDTILYALWTWDSSPTRGSHLPIAPLKGLSHVHRLIFEAGDLSDGNSPRHLTLQAWAQGTKEPHLITQVFSTSTEAPSLGPHLMAELPGRCLADGLLLVCGETNLVSWRSDSQQMADPFGIQTWMDAKSVAVVLNPVHDYMAWKMWRKRQYMSTGRVVVSVWNQGKGRDSPDGPWMVCRDGEIQTSLVEELRPPIPERPDLRIGILSLEESK